LNGKNVPYKELYNLVNLNSYGVIMRFPQFRNNIGINYKRAVIYSSSDSSVACGNFTNKNFYELSLPRVFSTRYDIKFCNYFYGVAFTPPAMFENTLRFLQNRNLNGEQYRIYVDFVFKFLFYSLFLNECII
jgi:hypothetical protein